MRFAHILFALMMILFFSACSSSPDKRGEPQAEIPIVKKERFIRYVPGDWFLAYKNLKGNMLMVEHVPQGENANEWTEILTFQTILEETQVAVVQFEKKMNAFWEKDCPGAVFSRGEQIVQNGYVTLTWKQACEMNPRLQKPQYALFKAVAGNDNFYVIRKAWRRIPSEDELADWREHLKNSIACDGRIPERDCAAAIAKMNEEK